MSSPIHSEERAEDSVQRLVLLDLFCGAGGAGEGYSRAGFDVVGVDIVNQPRNTHRFIQGDAVEYLEAHGHEYDLIHGSPPCQEHTPLKHRTGKSYACFIAATRRGMEKSGAPYVIENVVGAPLRNPITLCGAMFGLRSYRHRCFESSFTIKPPTHPKHVERVNRRGENRREHWNRGGFLTITGDIGTYMGAEAMGIDWMNGNELSQAIPPAYTEWVAREFLKQNDQAKTAALRGQRIHRRSFPARFERLVRRGRQE